MTNAEIILESIRQFDLGDIPGAGEFFDDAFVAIVPGIEPLNKPGLLTVCAVLKEACPDFELNPTITEAQGDLVKVLLAPTGTHTGVLRYPGITPVQPTGISIALPRHLFIYTVKGNKIVSAVVEDTSGGGLFGLLLNLGVEFPEAGEGREG